MLRLVNIEGGYTQGNNILKGISFEIPAGETLAVIGQNGSGKSSLAKAIINTLPFRKGEVWLDGENITNYPVQKIINKGVGVFLQGGKVFHHLTVKENLLIVGRNMSNRKLNSRIIELQDYFSIFNENKLWNLQASYLSGGQKTLLALFMVILNSPKFLILDEPSASLSVANVKEMFKVLSSIKELQNITILLIEQMVEQAINNSKTTFLIENGKFFDSSSIEYPENFKS
jgi:branched-chain amino acid transport system ATP-binding protein